ncbi:hypothetical protein SAMN05444161_3634 [Rhizobiales bacterium GAS191]|nr:hypothetical protein SAMN05519103_02783 [Rhizobiales bacterium GAS113]SED63506.1 hypothetical protein SAMN05444161_3634 [Rhizobiales bacterium GAS191]SEE75929.1 hypothetical protein SAMN05519104_7377 [Rhizobiales bacterium GAS188]
MRKLLLAVIFAAAMPALALAKTIKIPDDNTVAIITIPDAWTINEIDEGVEATSPDSGVYLAVEATATRDVKQSTVDAIKWLATQGVAIDASTMKQKDININGMDTVALSWEGKDKDGPTKVSVTLVAASAEKLLLLTYWASPDGEKANEHDLRAIASSIKSVK